MIILDNYTIDTSWVHLHVDHPYPDRDFIIHLSAHRPRVVDLTTLPLIGI